jgi:hypothetical protein
LLLRNSTRYQALMRVIRHDSLYVGQYLNKVSGSMAGKIETIGGGFLTRFRDTECHYVRKERLEDVSNVLFRYSRFKID